MGMHRPSLRRAGFEKKKNTTKKSTTRAEAFWTLGALGVYPLEGNQPERAAKADRQHHCLFLPRCSLECGLEYTEKSHTGQHVPKGFVWQVGKEEMTNDQTSMTHGEAVLGGHGGFDIGHFLS